MCFRIADSVLRTDLRASVFSPAVVRAFPGSGQLFYPMREPESGGDGPVRRDEVVYDGANFVGNVSLVVRISLFLHK